MLFLLSEKALAQTFRTGSRNDDLVFLEELALEIRLSGEAGINLLVAQFHAEDSAHLQAAILFALSVSEWDGEICPPVDETILFGLIEEALGSPMEMVVAEALDTLRYLEDTRFSEQVFSLWEHPSPYVKGSVLRYMAKLFPEKAYPVLIEALSDAHFIVRENAVDELSELELDSHQKEAVRTHLLNLADDPHPHVREAVETAREYLDDTD